MSRHKVAWIPVIGLLVLGIVGTALALQSQGDGKKAADEIPAVKKVSNQSGAIREAQKVDLPLLEKVDKVVIEEAKRGGGGKRITLDKADDIKELRQALKARGVPPSGGVTAATVSFYRGEGLLRKIWVFEGGEWGFERPGTSWTTGREGNLWKVIQKHLK
jgi:hypothetical protein